MNGSKEPVYGIIAGGGSLPHRVAASLDERNLPYCVVGLKNDVDAEGFTKNIAIHSISNISAIFKTLRHTGVTHLVLAGTIQSRPHWREFSLGFSLIKYLPRIMKALTLGDDGLLSDVGRMLEAEGFTLIGPHTLLNNATASKGPIAGPSAPENWQGDALKGFEAAKLLGHLDIGQGVIVAGGRVVAVEDLSGTDALLARIGDMRSSGRLTQDDRAILVKCAKPQQDMRIDMPTIGATTLENAHRNGIHHIIVEPYNVLIMDGALFAQMADRLGVSVTGWTPKKRGEQK